MERSLRRRGLVLAADAPSSDFHLINSCSFIESARVETIQTVLEASGLKKDRPAQKLILAGCFSERYASAVREELPEVDLSFGTGLYHRAGELLGDRFGLPQWSVADQAPGATAFASTRISSAPYAPVKISDGCNRGCAFCAIPSFRGAFRDIARPAILAECRALVAEGVREICLVSQDTNNYGGDAGTLLDLLEELHTVEGLRWIRLLYLYPDPRTEQIWRGIAERGLCWRDAQGASGGRIVPYLESPVQHVSADVLRAMRRFGSYERFRDLFGLVRALIPDLEIRTSFLVGYPGETGADVELLQEFIAEVRPEKLALFTYSPEEGTPGYAKGDPIPAAEKARRVNQVRQVHLELLREIHRERTGRRYRCMVDSVDPRGGQLVARRAQDAPEVDEVIFVERRPADRSGDAATRSAPGPGPAEKTPELALAPGDLLDVEINGFYEYDMTGEIVAATGEGAL
jgi:ribosomal protein S12 methylthiotransferase